MPIRQDSLLVLRAGSRAIRFLVPRMWLFGNFHQGFVKSDGALAA
jgi:hypothetical protein